MTIQANSDPLDEMRSFRVAEMGKAMPATWEPFIAPGCFVSRGDVGGVSELSGWCFGGWVLSLDYKPVRWLSMHEAIPADVLVLRYIDNAAPLEPFPVLPPLIAFDNMASACAFCYALGAEKISLDAAIKRCAANNLARAGSIAETDTPLFWFSESRVSSH